MRPFTIMHGVTIGLALVLGLIGAACAEPEPAEPETFMCGGWQCELEGEYCSFAVPCEGVIPSDPICVSVPAECEGVASLECLGPGCREAADGSFSCSPECP